MHLQPGQQCAKHAMEVAGENQMQHNIDHVQNFDQSDARLCLHTEIRAQPEEDNQTVISVKLLGVTRGGSHKFLTA